MRFTLAPLLLRPVAVCTAVTLVAHAVPVPVHADEAAPGATQVTASGTTIENLQVSFGGGTVAITYDLPAFEGQRTFEVTLEVSTNGGQTYDIRPQSMSGDVGRPVLAGPGKQIVWEFAKDVESLQTNQFRFRVVIRVETRPDVASSPPEPPPNRPGVQLPPLPAAIPTQGGRVAAGNRLLWPGLAMLGAGGALAAMAGAGPLRKRTDYAGYYELTPSKPAMYGGVGVAATGLVLLLLGRRTASSATLVVPIPGGVILYRAATF